VHYASYRDYPKQFSATEKPGLWFLEDFYRNLEEISGKILNREFDDQLLNVYELKECPAFSNISEVEEFIFNYLKVKYFPSVKDNKIVPKEVNLREGTDYKASVKSFDKADKTRPSPCPFAGSSERAQ